MLNGIFSQQGILLCVLIELYIPTNYMYNLGISYQYFYNSKILLIYLLKPDVTVIFFCISEKGNICNSNSLYSLEILYLMSIIASPYGQSEVL